MHIPLPKKIFKNTRFYDLNGDFEAVYYRFGWGLKDERIAKQGQHLKKIKSARGTSPNYAENRKKTMQKAKSKIRRLIKCYSLDRFVTLTFAENIQDVKLADAEFRKFMKRVLRRFPDCKYVAVREFQKRGAVHYHLAINTYIEQKKLNELWGNGFVWIERPISTQRQLINYVCKYLTKLAGDERLKGYHVYLCSQGLKLFYQDSYFDSGEEMVQHLTKEYGNKMMDKQVGIFEDGKIVWVG